MNQKEAVFQAVNAVFSEHGIAFESGMDANTLLTKELKGQVVEILFTGFQNKTVGLSATIEDAHLKGYCSSLLSNWLRKDTRLNGGVKYVAKNPGSRAGSGDEQVKAMKQLLKIHPGDEDIINALNARLAEIGASKVNTPTVNFEALPEALRAKFSK